MVLSQLSSVDALTTIFPFSRFMAVKSERGDWFVFDRDHGRASSTADGKVRTMGMRDAIDTADWLNTALLDGRIKPAWQCRPIARSL